MIRLPLYHSSLCAYWPLHLKFITEIYDTLSRGGKFHVNTPALIDTNMLQPRHGEWSMPWETAVIPKFAMPEYDPTFNKSFAEVTDNQAIEVRDLIRATDKNVVVFYSGGIDSTVCMAALVKNLNKEELKKVKVNLSMDSIVENPQFYIKFIKDKIDILDSNKFNYGDACNNGYYSITLDQGDSIFGTELGTSLYTRFNEIAQSLSSDSQKHLLDIRPKIISPEVHYSEFADLLINYFNRPKFGVKIESEFGKLFYEKLHRNVQTSTVPINSLHDFFWWMIFNVKYIHCSVRSTFSYGYPEFLKKNLLEQTINWFNHPDYQRWSMVNNNNGEKIKGISENLYKWAAKKYIYDFDKNDWYLNYKLKIGSLRNLFIRNHGTLDLEKRFGFDYDYNLLRIDDPEVRNFIITNLQQYQVDWTE